MPSPHPLSIEDKLARGNPGKRKLNEVNPKLEILYELPPAPGYLGDYGSKEWNRTGPKLVEMKLLAETDLPAFESYCMNIDLMIEARKSIQEEGMLIMGARGWVRNPAIAAFGQASTAVRGFVAEFGLSPSARSRIKLPTEDSFNLEDLMRDDGDDEL